MTFKLNFKLALLLITISLSACVVVPTARSFQANGCKISSDRKTLKAVDVAKALITIIRLAVWCFIQAVALCQGYMSRLIMFITTVKKK